MRLICACRSRLRRLRRRCSAGVAALWVRTGAGGKSDLGANRTRAVTTNFATDFANGLGFGNNISGPIYGGQVGCDYQWPGSQFVIGVSGSWAGADINGQRDHNRVFTGLAAPVTSASLSTSLHTKVDELASVTGRIGWAATGIFGNNNVLIYFKGGGAWMHQRTDISGSLTSTLAPNGVILPFAGNFTNNKSGWTVGGGFEWALSFAPQASIFWEYDYYSFNHKDLLFDVDRFPIGAPAVTHFDLGLNPKINTVKVGINYRFFGGPGYGGP